MRRDHRPLWMRQGYDAFESWYVRHFLKPQFDSLGEGYSIKRPWDVELYGPGIRAGKNLHLYNTRGLVTRFTTWHRGGATPSIEIGDNVLISPGFLGSAAAGITIGDNVMIAAHVYISDSDWHDLYDRGAEAKAENNAPVELAENCWIGFRSIVAKGVRIGRNSVIGAGSIVTSSIPDNVIAAGSPAKVIRALDPTMPIGTRASLFPNQANVAAWNRALMEIELAGNTSAGWLRHKIWPTDKD